MDAGHGFHSLNMIVSGTDLARTLSSSTEPGPFPRTCEEKHSGLRNLPHGAYCSSFGATIGASIDCFTVIARAQFGRASPSDVRSRELVQVLTRFDQSLSETLVPNRRSLDTQRIVSE